MQLSKVGLATALKMESMRRKMMKKRWVNKSQLMMATHLNARKLLLILRSTKLKSKEKYTEKLLR